MTNRHFLTLRVLAIVGGCSAIALAPLAWFISPNFSESAGSEVVAQAGSPRYLAVVTSRLGMAGPECLTQAFTGVIKPKRSSLLAAKDIGLVDAVLVEMGDRVEAGTLLILLEHASLDAERQAVAARLGTAQAQLAELRVGPRREDIDQAAARVRELQAALALRLANLQRNERLVKSAAISPQEYDAARYAADGAQAQLAAAEYALAELRAGTRSEQVEAAEANVRALEADLQRLDVRIEEQAIHAPFAGAIQARMVDEGAVVSPGQGLLQIVESGELEVHVGLPVELTASLTADDLHIELNGLKLSCAIDRLSPAVNEATRTRDVVLRLSDAPSSVVLGSAVDVVVRRACNTPDSVLAGQAFWVPRDALNTAARGLWAVMIARPSERGDGLYEIERRQVELVRAQGDWAEIRGPIAADERMVTQGVHRVTPGQIVVLDE